MIAALDHDHPVLTNTTFTILRHAGVSVSKVTLLSALEIKFLIQANANVCVPMLARSVTITLTSTLIQTRACVSADVN